MPCFWGKGTIPARILALALCALGFEVQSLEASFVIPVDSRATYLLTNDDPGAQNASAIDLGALGILPGDLIFLERLGDYSFDVLGPPVRPDDVTNMVGVFSGSSTLLDASNLHRIPDAIAATGYLPLVPWTTDPTFVGGLTTDIAEDFYIGPAAVYVPAGAAYLFVSPADSRFSDNGDPDGDYALRITKITAVPEASTLILGSLGLTALVLVRRRRPAP
jgi:hypothetical protein